MLFKRGIFVASLSIIVVSIQALHWSGMRLFDLECQGKNFVKEAELWGVTTSQLYNKTKKTTQCVSDIILGGPGIWNTIPPLSGWWKQYSNLPPHQGLTVHIKIYPVDRWLDDHFAIQIDTISQDYWVLNQETNPTALNNICGPSTPDILPLTVYQTVAHTSSRMYLYIFAWISSPSDIASMGVREIVLSFFNSSNVSSSSCGVAPFDLGSNACSCESSMQVVNGKSGYCSPCDSSCLICNKPGASGCTACRPGDYLTDSGSCLKCFHYCATCSGDPDYCITCKDGSEPVNGTCPPFDDCAFPLKLIQDICQPDCASNNEYASWDGCISDCVAPLKIQTISNYSVCIFPCQNSSMFLYWNGTCSDICPPPLEAFTFSNRSFCTFPCSKNEIFSFWNGTCSDACSLPLIAKQLGDRRICTFPCESEDDYLYLDGSCKKDCPPPYISQTTEDSKRFCSLICTERQYLASDKKTCQNIRLPGQFEFSTILDNQYIQLSMIERTFNQDIQNFRLFSEEYTLGPTWTFFTLRPQGEYILDKWETTSSCGCIRQECGRDCHEGFECHEFNDNSPWICHPWAPKNNFCWSIVSKGRRSFHSYSLRHLTTIALTSYGGLDKQLLRPGFTLNYNQNLTLNYASNGIITKVEPRNHGILEVSYRYAESERRLLTTEEFSHLNHPPKIKADLGKASCTSSAIILPITLDPSIFSKQQLPFHSYSILRRAEIKKLTEISGLDILTPQGVLEWSRQEFFDFLDPCNQLFLTLQKDEVGNFFVRLPPSQRLVNSERVICIAVNDNPHSQYDLVLYELRNSTAIWSASDRFLGLLSKDYIQDLTIRLTTEANLTLDFLEGISIDIQFHVDIEPVLLKITTTQPTTCKIYLSPTCVLDIFTTNKFLYATEPIQSDCGYLYEKAAYDCQGIIGYFFPPLKMVEPKLNSFMGMEINDEVEMEAFISSTPSGFSEDIFVLIWVWFVDWNSDNCLTKMVSILVIMLLAMSLCFIASKFYKRKSSIRYTPFD